MATHQTGEITLGELTSQLEELNRVGAALAAERDTGALLALILTKARDITSSDAGSLYIVEPGDGEADGDGERPRRLRFMIAQNDSVDVPFEESSIDVSDRSIAGYVAQTGETVMLEDAYAIPADAPYSFNRSFDLYAGYRTRSVLAKPLRTPKGHAQLDLVRDRFKLARRGRELAAMQKRLDYVLAHGRDAYFASAPAFDNWTVEPYPY